MRENSLRKKKSPSTPPLHLKRSDLHPCSKWAFSAFISYKNKEILLTAYLPSRVFDHSEFNKIAVSSRNSGWFRKRTNDKFSSSILIGHIEFLLSTGNKFVPSPKPLPPIRSLVEETHTHFNASSLEILWRYCKKKIVTENMSTVRERPEPLSGKDEGYEVV